jgi:hypothetical protein
MSLITILSSAVYRTIELAGGWNGRVISTQRYFSALMLLFYLITLVIPFFSTDVLDGAMVTLAIFTLNIAHPGLLLDDSYNLRYNTALSPLTNSKTMA